jgi:hypothetical protein
VSANAETVSTSMPSTLDIPRASGVLSPTPSMNPSFETSQHFQFNANSSSGNNHFQPISVATSIRAATVPYTSPTDFENQPRYAWSRLPFGLSDIDVQRNLTVDQVVPDREPKSEAGRETSYTWEPPEKEANVFRND